MSEVAGRMSVQVGAHYLEKEQGGRGVLLGGVPGVAPARVAILGGGVSGINAAQMAVGMRADVTIYDISTGRLAEIDEMFDGRVKTAMRSKAAIAARCEERARRHRRGAGPGRRRAQAGHARHAQADEARQRAGRHRHRPGRLLRDQPRRRRTHDPVYVVDGIIHYCVANMPGAVARTSTFALNNATLPFVLRLANAGAEAAMAADPHLAAGLNVAGGHIRHQAVADALGLEFAA